MPIEPGPRGRMLIPVLVAVFGVALGVGGIMLLRPYTQAASPQRAALDAIWTAAKKAAGATAPIPALPA